MEVMDYMMARCNKEEMGMFAVTAKRFGPDVMLLSMKKVSSTPISWFGKQGKRWRCFLAKKTMIQW
jgi:hypothetical protein